MNKAVAPRHATIFYLKMSAFQPNIARERKKLENMTHIRKKKQATEMASESSPMSDLTEKDFKEAIKNMFKELKETTIREVNKVMTTRSH